MQVRVPQHLSGESARRAWLDAEDRARRLIQPEIRPSYAQTFLSGVLRGSMLQMAVCAPPRQAASADAGLFLRTNVGRAVTGRAERPALAGQPG